MKTFLTMTLVVVLGVMLTTAVSLARLGTPLSWSPLGLDLPAEPDYVPTKVATNVPSPSPDQAGPKPIAVVEETEFDFGNLRNKTIDHRHVFKVSNKGDAPLRFTNSSVSCSKCTFIDLPEAPIAPGETAEVVVRWNIDVVEDDFRQSARVQTNDPEHEELRFVISGKVVRPLAFEPKKLVFSNIHVGEQSQAKIRLLAYFSDQLAVTEQKLSDAKTSEYFDVKITPLASDQLERQAKSGIDVTVTLKPGLPMGKVTQILQLKTNIEEDPDVSIDIEGEVIGSVIISHKDWDRDLKFLRVGPVKQSDGAKPAPLNLIIRGADLTDLKLEPPEISDPEALKVTYGEIVEVKPGTLVRVPVIIEVPPGAHLVNHMGGSNEDQKMASIMIPTNKPELGRLKLSVRFAVIADD